MPVTALVVVMLLEPSLKKRPKRGPGIEGVNGLCPFEGYACKRLIARWEDIRIVGRQALRMPILGSVELQI